MKYRFKTKPYRHQVKALRHLHHTDEEKTLVGGGLWVPMRWGKTKVCIDFAGTLAVKYGCERVLVITTASGVGVWEDEIDIHQPDDIDLNWWILNYEATYERVSMYEDDDEEYGEYLGWQPADDPRILRWVAKKKTLVIVDESHHIGRPSTLQSRKIHKIGQLATWRVFMTGSPWHRKPFFVFGQFKFYDESIFGTAWGPFKKNIAIFGGFQNREVLKYRNLKWLGRQCKPHVFIQEYVPPRPPIVQRIPFSLEESRDIYRQMEREMVARTDEGLITAPIVLTKHLRCQQIAGGWTKVEKEPEVFEWVRVGKEKLRAFTDLVTEMEENGIDKFVVGCRFLPEVRDVAEACKKLGYKTLILTGGTPKEIRKRKWKTFNRTKQRVVFISQVQTGREAINLSGASVMVLYSLPADYLTYDQFTKRIEKYKDTRTLVYYIMTARGTRDEVNLVAINQQADVARLIMRRPELVERITARA